MSIEAAKIITKIKEEYFQNLFDEDWIKDTYLLLFENETLHKELDKIILEETDNVLFSIKDMYIQYTSNLEMDNRQEEVIVSNNKLGEDEELVNIAPLDNSQPKFVYSYIISEIISKKFQEYEEYEKFNSIHGLVNQATKLYENKDELHKLISLTKGSDRIKDIIASKRGKNFLDRLMFEDFLIDYFRMECEKGSIESYFTIINVEPDVYCNYTDENIKLVFTKNFTGVKNIMQFLFAMNNHSLYSKWFPFVSESEDKTIFSKSKSIYYIKSEIPIIQDRELYLYSFVHNKLEDEKKITFYSKSVDNNISGETEEYFVGMVKPKHLDDVLRVYSYGIAFEVTILSKDEIDIKAFVEISHKLKFVNIQLVEVISKQISKKILEKFDEIIKDPKITSSNVKVKNEYQEQFYNFYSDVIDKVYLKLGDGLDLNKEEIDSSNSKKKNDSAMLHDSGMKDSKLDVKNNNKMQMIPNSDSSRPKTNQVVDSSNMNNDNNNDSDNDDEDNNKDENNNENNQV